MTGARTRTGEVLLAGGSVESLDAYMARGGGQGLCNRLGALGRRRYGAMREVRASSTSRGTSSECAWTWKM